MLQGSMHPEEIHQPDRRPELLSSVAVATMPQHYQMSEKEGKTKAA